MRYRTFQQQRKPNSCLDHCDLRVSASLAKKNLNGWRENLLIKLRECRPEIRDDLIIYSDLTWLEWQPSQLEANKRQNLHDRSPLLNGPLRPKVTLQIFTFCWETPMSLCTPASSKANNISPPASSDLCNSEGLNGWLASHLNSSLPCSLSNVLSKQCTCRVYLL